jgi:hypothetical protein
MAVMSWAKFDDRYHDNPKVKLAWRAHPRAVGLHSMAITYCAMHETDGLVDPMWLEERLPNKRERTNVLTALVGAGLFAEAPNGYFIVNDYLEYNPSRAESEAKRADKSAAGKKGAAARWGREPDGSSHSTSHSNGNGTSHSGSHDSEYYESIAAPNSPDPTRPGVQA